MPPAKCATAIMAGEDGPGTDAEESPAALPLVGIMPRAPVIFLVHEAATLGIREDATYRRR